MKKFSQILSTIIIVVLILSIAAVLGARIFGINVYEVKSYSMEPEIPKGSLIVVFPCSYEDIKIGDDITYVYNENRDLNTHRVIEKNDEKQKITTQGVANNVSDTPILYQNIIGVVRFHCPVLGYVLTWLSSLQGKIITITLIVALLIVSIMINKLSSQN